MQWLATGTVSGSVLLGSAAALAEPAWRRWRAAGTAAGNTYYPGITGDWHFGDPRLAAHLVTALCHLQREFLALDAPPPKLAAVLAGSDRIILRLAQPAGIPPVPPWRAEAGDRSGQAWLIDTAELTGWEPGPFPYPALAVIGHSDGWTVLLDLAQAPGPIALAGDPARAGQALGALAAGLANSPWSRGSSVVAVGPVPAPEVPEPGRLRWFASVEEAASYAERFPTGTAAGPLVLLLAHPPEGGAADTLARFAAGPGGVVVFAGEPLAAGDGWTLHANPSSELPYGALPVAAAGETTVVRMLGPLEVRGPGEDPPARRLRELVAVAALQPEGVPRPLADELLSTPDPAGLTRTLHDWLGADPAGLPRLRERDGAWRLPSDVWVDWHQFRELATSDQATGREDERQRLVDALNLVRGELFTGHPDGEPLSPLAQRILGSHIAEIRDLVIHTVRRLAALAADAGDPQQVDWALRTGLTLLPHVEGLWRTLLLFRAEHEPATLAETVQRMQDTLLPDGRRRRRRLERATRDLLARLPPSQSTVKDQR